MKSFWILLVSVAAWLPYSGYAEIYKWKDSNGVTRYSDTPPPSSVKQLPMSGKKPSQPNPADGKAAEPQPGQPAAGQGKPETKKAGPAAKESTPVEGREEAAMKRQEAAEAEKKKAQQMEAEAKAKQANCENAKTRLRTYTLGGRIYDVDEKGERVYKSDEDIAKGLEEARQDVEKYCE